MCLLIKSASKRGVQRVMSDNSSTPQFGSKNNCAHTRKDSKKNHFISDLLEDVKWLLANNWDFNLELVSGRNFRHRISGSCGLTALYGRFSQLMEHRLYLKDKRLNRKQNSECVDVRDWILFVTRLLIIAVRSDFMQFHWPNIVMTGVHRCLVYCVQKNQIL